LLVFVREKDKEEGKGGRKRFKGLDPLFISLSKQFRSRGLRV